MLEIWGICPNEKTHDCVKSEKNNAPEIKEWHAHLKLPSWRRTRQSSKKRSMASPVSKPFSDVQAPSLPVVASINAPTGDSSKQHLCVPQESYRVPVRVAEVCREHRLTYDCGAIWREGPSGCAVSCADMAPRLNIHEGDGVRPPERVRT